MSDFARSTKRAVTRVSTTPRALNAAMNQEFVDTRRRLNDISLAIKRLTQSVNVTRQAWTSIARQQRDFSQSLSASFPESGSVQQHAAEVEKNLRNVQQDLILNDMKEPPHQQILSVLDKYLDMLQSIKKEYKEVEVSYTEKMRYQRKVDKLEKKNNNNRKNSDKLVRNIEKLNDSQKELDNKLDVILERMRSAFQKHEAVLQCAHHSFWMANNAHMDTIEQATHDIRVESVAVHELLLGLELFEDKQLAPVPRPNLIEASSNEPPKQIENGQATPAITNDPQSVTSSTEPVSFSNENTEFPDETGGIEAEQDLKMQVETRIPSVPTEKLTLPVTQVFRSSTNPDSNPIAV